MLKKYVVLMIILSLFVFGCKKEEKKVIVGTNASYAPFEYIENGNIVGFDIDLSKAILEKAGYKVEIVDMDFGGLIPALITKKIDIIAAGMVENPERAEKINFSDGYYISGAKIAVIYDNDTIKSIEDIEGLTVGAELGTTNVDILKEAGANVIEYNNSADLYTALISGKIVALVANTTNINDYIKQHPDQIKIVGDFLKQSDICFGINKDNVELLDNVNKALNELKENGEYEKLVKKWLE